MKLTPFETEILDHILWQVEGVKSGKVTLRATTRILRATLRRIRPRLVARSQSIAEGKGERDHAIPLHVICDRILKMDRPDRNQLMTILGDWLVAVELTAHEHRIVLRARGLARKMPEPWDGADRLARYRQAGIQLTEILPAADGG